jgi:hypothetical protein
VGGAEKMFGDRVARKRGNETILATTWKGKKVMKIF